MPSLTKKRGKKRWKAVKVVHGIRREKWFPDATKKSERAAVAWEKKAEKEMRAAGAVTITPSSNISLGQWATQYLDYAQARFVHKTYDEKRRCFDRFFTETSKTRPVQTLTPGDVLRFLQSEMKARSGNQANRARKNIVAAWNWGMRYLSPALPGPNPGLVEKMPERRKARYIPPESDFWKLFDVCDDEQDRLMLLMALHTAARRGELFRLRRSDIDMHANQIRLWTRKRLDSSWEFDWLPMTAALRSPLLAWMDRRFAYQDIDPDHVFVCLEKRHFAEHYYGKPFQYRRHWMRRLCKRASVASFGFHAIRHLTASILYRAGEPLEVIQMVLRHKSATTTNRYLHSLGSAHVRAAMDNALIRPTKRGI